MTADGSRMLPTASGKGIPERDRGRQGIYGRGLHGHIVRHHGAGKQVQTLGAPGWEGPGPGRDAAVVGACMQKGAGHSLGSFLSCRRSLGSEEDNGAKLGLSVSRKKRCWVQAMWQGGGPCSGGMRATGA